MQQEEFAKLGLVLDSASDVLQQSSVLGRQLQQHLALGNDVVELLQSYRASNGECSRAYGDNNARDEDLFGVVEQPGVSLGLDLLDHGGAFLGGGSLHYNPSFSCDRI